RIGSASMRQCRAHLGDGISETEIHDGDDNGADKHAAPAADGKTEIPAGEISRDHGGDAERPERDDAGMAPEVAPIGLVLTRNVVGDPAFMLRFSHCAISFSNRLLCQGKLRHSYSASSRPGI